MILPKIAPTNAATQLACDYLIVGAGAASIAFIDTLLTEHPSSKIVVVDKNSAPGGHWNHAYPFVRLHQPSLLYGVASRQLEGNWMKLLFKGMLPWQHRASKDELLKHYSKFIQDKVDAGQLQYFPNCQYNFEPGNDGNLHSFSSVDNSRHYSVHVDKKLVNGILGQCIVPSQNPLAFPVDKEVSVMTPNQIYDSHHAGVSNNKKQYVVLGCGKTAMDAVVYLQRTMKVKPANISWVIPNDVWMMVRESEASPWSWPQAMLDNDLDESAASLDLEKKGAFVRLDKNVLPTRFRFPVIGKDELKYMRRIRNIIRRGRVTAIHRESGKIRVEFGADKEPWLIEQEAGNDTIFVHCTSPGPFNGNSDLELFASDNQLNLSLIFAPPVPISMSVLASLESARLRGTLDIAFGRKLVQVLDEDKDTTTEQAPSTSDNDVLKRLMMGMSLKEGDKLAPLQSLLNLAIFLALVDEDPLVGFKFMKQNRLSFFSIPGFRGEVYETLGLMLEKSKVLGYSRGQVRMIEVLREKLQVLEGK